MGNLSVGARGVFALLRKANPPPWNDLPPLSAYTLSLGLLLGRILERGEASPRGITEAGAAIIACRDVPEVVTTIWGEEWGYRAASFYKACEDVDARAVAERHAEMLKQAERQLDDLERGLEERDAEA